MTISASYNYNHTSGMKTAQLVGDEPEERLFRRVILQAIIDIARVYTSKATNRIAIRTNKYNHDKAMSWVVGFSSDFIECCEYSDFDPKKVQRAILKLVEDIKAGNTPESKYFNVLMSGAENITKRNRRRVERANGKR